MEALKQMRFSDRIGLTKPNQFIQYDSMNKPLRNHLWNALHMFYWSKSSHSYMIYFGERNRIAYLLEDIWNRYFNYKIDNLSNKVNDNIKVISDYFSECNWYEVYNFLEFVLEADNDKNNRNQFKEYCNAILEEDFSGYRFIGDTIVPITSEVEIKSIEQAQNQPSKFSNVSQHIKQAQVLFSKRPKPDYRNSIKESISAVEALCSIISGKEHASLGEAIKLMRKKEFPMHPAFINALNSLYGYTSNADGIRHSLLDKENLTSADAKFMLVVCSTFVNYIIEIESKN